MADVEIRVLGPLEVRVDGRVVPIGSRKQRALLAALAVEDNRPVSTDALAELLWGDEGAPPSVRVTLRSLVSRLRRALGPAGCCLAARGSGYVLKVDRAAVDAVRFERGLAWGRDRLAAGHATDAVVTLRDALALWRGPAHAELDGHEFARPSAHRLEEARLTAVEDLVDAELRAGLTADALARAEGQVAAQPLRERAWGQVMLARYRSGRQADALAAYSACATAMASGQAVVVPDVTSSPIFAGTEALAVMVGARALAVHSTPMVDAEGRVFGVVSTHYHRTHRPEPGQLALMAILAGVCADALARADRTAS